MFSRDDANRPNSPSFLTGGGDMGRLIRAHEWSATPLGPANVWPQSLKIAVRLLLNSRHPMFIWWGPELIQFYNDAYAESLGPEKHPSALGTRGRDTWPEIWSVIGPQIAQVMTFGEATWHEDQLVPIVRHGGLEEMYWTYGFSPIDDEAAANGIGGVMVICRETIAHVVADRAFKRVFAASPAPFLVLAPDAPRFTITDVNDAYLAATMTTRQGIVGRGVFDAFPDNPDDARIDCVSTLRASLERVLATRQPDRLPGLKYDIARPDGSFEERWWSPSNAAVLDEHGEVEAIIHNANDETEQRRADAALRELNDTLEQKVAGQTAERNRVWEMSRDLLAIMGFDGFLKVINPAWEATLGRDTATLLSDSFQEQVHPDDHAPAQAAMERLLLGETVERFEDRLLHADGSWRWISWTLVPECDVFYAVGRDVTEDRERAAVLRRYHDIIEATASPICAFDTDYRLIAFNQAHNAEFRRVNGFDSKAGDVFPDLFVPEQRPVMRALMTRALSGDSFTVVEEFGRPELGKPFWEISYTPLRDEAGQIVGAFHQALDISGRLLAEAELEAAQDALRESQKLEAMGQLTGGVAHDINNLLTPIMGSLDLLRRRGVGGEREQRMIDGALQSADRAKTLVQRLLAFARRQPLQPVPVDVSALVTGMADLIVSTSGPRIRVELDIETDLPPALADPNQLEMAILNLAVNARDAMSDSGTLTIRARPVMVAAGERSALTAGQYVRLSVTDTGTGMDPETLARAIEPFYSTKGVGKGTGLGLSMAHGLAAQLGGALNIQSQPGLGTCVELWLPVSRQAARTSDRPSADETRPVSGIALLVDDEELVRASTADMLADLGYAVVEADSAEEALRLVESGVRFDVMLTDHLMPGMTGTELAREVRHRRPDTPVIVVSGYADVEGIAPDLPRLTKPFRRDDLVGSLAALAGRD